MNDRLAEAYIRATAMAFRELRHPGSHERAKATGRWRNCEHDGIDIRRFGDADERYLCRKCGGEWTEEA